MPTINQKQINQSLNIVNTIIEAAEHFQGLVRKKEKNQAIFILGSIVDGIQALNQNGYINSTHQNLSGKLEKNLLLIAKNIENDKSTKILEITQFSLIPNLKKLQLLFEENNHINKEKEQIKIGVYGIQNPLLYYPQPRIEAMVKESEKQNAILYFFGDNDVNFSEKMIDAVSYQNGEKKQVTIPFPDVINNTSAKKTHIGRKLLRTVPFTNYFHVGNKISLPQRLVQTRNKYVKLLVPFQLCHNKEKILNFIESNNKVVFKHLEANRGENIYFVTKKKHRYILLDQKKENILVAEEFDKWLDDIILNQKGSYIIQKYIHTRTKNNEPYHIRSHVQKNASGKWQVTYIYPRIGNKKSNLSNISTEGRIEDFHEFLMNEYGDKQGKKYAEDILKLSIDVAWNLDKLYGMAIDELGLDFAIDDKGKIWMHEANNGPQTAFHEDQRAVNTIGYAKYIYKNGIVHSLSANSIQKNQFNSHTSNLSTRHHMGKKLLGLIVPNIAQITPLQRALISSAEMENIDICLIRPNDIDFENLLIRGHFYDRENQEWKPSISSYPDIILDELKAKDNEHLKFVYEELENIPFINHWSNQIVNIPELYQQLEKNEKLAPLLPNYARIKKLRDVFHWVNKYHSIKLILEAEDEIMYINQLQNNKFEVISQQKTQVFSEFQLTQHFEKILVKKRVIVEADTYEFPRKQFNLHLIRDININKWNIANVTFQTANNGNELLHTNQISFLNSDEKQIDIDEFNSIEANLMEYSELIAAAIQDYYSMLPLNELEITFQLSKDNEIAISKVNPCGPAYTLHPERYAKLVIKLGVQLISSNEVL
ncbi:MULTISPECIES: YheC/YheD family protein [Oceanobacillus]|uniref:YheC/YheD family protein n=1 Tax=Oceanobacillus TaxID=182709 RepID=UPI0030D75573